MSEPPSYHDLHITTATIGRKRLFDLPYGLQVHCTRVSGWQLWQYLDNGGAAVPAAGSAAGSHPL